MLQSKLKQFRSGGENCPRKRAGRRSSSADMEAKSRVSQLDELQRILTGRNEEKNNFRTWPFFLKFSTLVVAIAGGIFLLCATIVSDYVYEVKTAQLVPPDPINPQPPSWSKLRAFRRGAVSMDGEQCALIGKSILEKNGSAVDAAIAAMVCNGLINMQSMGFGGGFFMTIYQRANQEAIILDARESAPLAARADMYDDLPPFASQIGPMAIAVPGELAGYQKVHERFGRLRWSELFEPSIAICEDGYKLTKFQRDSLEISKEAVLADPTLRSWFVDEQTNGFHKPGTVVRPIKLCETIRLIATGNATEFYNGSLGRMFVEDLRGRGSILTREDLAVYRAKWTTPISTRLSTGETLHTVGPPGSGAILALLLNILDGYGFDSSSLATPDSTLTTHQRTLEAFKYAYALRTQLADPEFVDLSALLHNLTSRHFADEIRRKINDTKTWNDPGHYGAFGSESNGDHGTAHISILAPNGDAVSVTSSINLHFGTGVVSERTGILTSSSMDDFGLPSRINYQDLPASPNNRIGPGKRPLSSMTPSIVVDSQGDVRMVVGAAGGARITTAIAYVVMRHLWMKETIKEAVDAARIHHQLMPMRVSYEYGVPKPLIDGLRAMGHETSRYRDRGSVVSAIVRVNDTIYGNADYRKGGEVYGLD